MPDIKDLLSGEYVTVEFVKNSPTKKGVFLNEGVIAEDDYKNTKLSVRVEIDGQTKTYKPNKSSLEHVSKVLGTISDAWIGKVVNFSIQIINGKESVIAIPEQEQQQPVIEKVVQ